MGIPSYYKKLKQFARKSLDVPVGNMWFDFNCVVYDCLRRPGMMEAYHGEEGRVEWENMLIEEVVKYTKELIGEVFEEGEKRRVFIAIDGVVPMAKIRQQRLRRFRSRWQKEEGVVSWDTNAITPGTEFMERLCARLKKENWTVSGADEPGEGEQKVMARLREREGGAESEAQADVIYGLDADLIILSLLQSLRQKRPIYLMREEYQEGGEPIVTYLEVNELRAVLSGNDNRFMLDYIFAMTLMGNDFLPHSMSLTLRDRGHDTFLSLLREFVKKRGHIIRGNVGGVLEYDWGNVVELLKEFEKHEEAWIVKKIRGKFLMPREGDEAKVGRAEGVLLEDGRSWQLKKGWKRVYYDSWFKGVRMSDLVKEYYTGLNWVLNYYTGQAPVSYDWYYPWNLPALWVDLAGNGATVAGSRDGWKPALGERLLKPQEQLAAVLPLESWWLVRDPAIRKLPALAPAFWPKKNDKLFTAGRTWFWECTVEIPILWSKTLITRLLRA